MIMKHTFIASCLLGLLCWSCGSSPKQETSTRPEHDYYVAAFIWPSCHDDSLGHVHLWPQGHGEWEVIQKGNPRFEGHYQPKQPLWGYEHDDDPRVVERWIDTALEYGVVDMGAGHRDPRHNFRVFRLQGRKVDGILHPYRLVADGGGERDGTDQPRLASLREEEGNECRGGRHEHGGKHPGGNPPSQRFAATLLGHRSSPFLLYSMPSL